MFNNASILGTSGTCLFVYHSRVKSSLHHWQSLQALWLWRNGTPRWYTFIRIVLTALPFVHTTEIGSLLKVCILVWYTTSFVCLHKTFVYHLPSGVAYVRIEVKGFNLHLFCTHVSFNQSPSLVYKLLKLFQSLDARPVRRRGGHYGPIFHPSRLSVVRAGKVHQPDGLQLLEPFLARPHRPRWWYEHFLEGAALPTSRLVVLLFTLFLFTTFLT